MPGKHTQPMDVRECMRHCGSHFLSMGIGASNLSWGLFSVVEPSRVAPKISALLKIEVKKIYYNILIHNPSNDEQGSIRWRLCAEEITFLSNEFL